MVTMQKLNENHGSKPKLDERLSFAEERLQSLHLSSNVYSHALMMVKMLLEDWEETDLRGREQVIRLFPVYAWAAGLTNSLPEGAIEAQRLVG